MTAAALLRHPNTLLGAPAGDLAALGPGTVAACGVYCDHTSGAAPGGRFATRQLRYAASRAHGEPVPVPGVIDVGDLNVFPLEPSRNEAALADAARRIAGTGACLLLAGSDYGVTPAIVGGLADALGCPLAVVRISCRADDAPGPARDRNTATARLRAAGHDVLLVGAAIAQTADERAIPATTVARRPDAAAAAAEAYVRGPLFVSVDRDALAIGSDRGLSLAAAIDFARALDRPFAGAELTGFVPDLGLGGQDESASLAAVLSALASALAGGVR